MDPIYEAYRQVNEAKNAMSNQYPDSAKGATKAFYDLVKMDYKSVPEKYTSDFKGQKPIKDPSEQGVWMFKSKNNPSEVAVVYLKGYRDSYGSPRKENEVQIGSM